jgi:hypothetical protein
MSDFLQKNDDKKGDIVDLSENESEYSNSESESEDKLFNICDFCEENEIEFMCQTCFSRICYSCRSRCSKCMETICPDCETDDDLGLCQSCLEENDNSSNSSDNDYYSDHTEEYDETDEDIYSDLDE